MSRECLQNDYPSIKNELENLFLQVTQEIDLIRDDNLARGKLIEVVNTTFEKETGNSLYSPRKKEIFKTILDEESPVEFWGAINYASDNYLTNTDKYPWMPTTISDDKELPF